jgi:hypothetical protein
MAQALTHQMLARESAKMLVEETNIVRHLNTSREKEFGEEVNGFKKGSTVRVKVPPVPTVFDGADFAGGGTAPAWDEQFVSFTVDTQKHVPLTFTSAEMKLELSDFKERFLRPAINSLGSMINADLQRRIVPQVPNIIGTWGSIPNTRRIYREADALLEERLCPRDQRFIHFSSDANTELAEANSALFHASEEIRREFEKNQIGTFADFGFFQNQSIASHANGAGTGYVTNGANQVGSSITVGTGTGAITRGSIVTFSGIFAVHPITGQSNGKLRTFVVTADFPGGAGNVQVYPAVTPTTSTQVGTASGAIPNGTAMTVFGNVSQSRRQNLALHKNAFAAAFPPLSVRTGCEGYTATVKGISVRVMSFGDGYKDNENTRVDVLYGLCGVRPDHAVRITE